MIGRAWTGLVWLAVAACGNGGVPAPTSDPAPTRIVTLGGSVTELVFAVGAGDRVIGVDATSLYPEEVGALPKVGVYRQVAAEGILSLGPDLVVASADAGPPSALAQIEAAGVRVEVLPAGDTVDAARARIRRAGALFDADDRAAALVDRLDADIAGVVRPEEPPRVLFVYARGAGALSVAGTDTSAHAMIELAGGVNAVTAWSGYRPLTPEALVSAAPDVILLTIHGLASLGGEPGLLGVPGVSLTPAGRAGRVVVLDDLLLLGFGPRTGEAARSLAMALRP